MNDEAFVLDPEQYRVVDLSFEVVPWKDRIGDRPFLTEISPTLPDGKDKEVVFTHTHVGTHVEGPLHFFGSGAKALSDFPLNTFMGRAVVLPIRLPDGELETKPWFNGPTMIEVNERLARLLEESGNTAHYTTFCGGHDYVCWRGTLADGLLFLAGDHSGL